MAPLSSVGRARLAAEIFATYARARWALRRSDLPRTLGRLRRAAPRSGWIDADTQTHLVGARLAVATSRTLRALPIDSRCLMQSLVLVGLLSRRGIRSVLVLGVDPKARFEAHAWVEHDEAALLPRGSFGRLVEL